jgi:hypothetical protein
VRLASSAYDTNRRYAVDTLVSPAAVLGLILVVGVIVTVWSGLRVRKPGAGRDPAMPSATRVGAAARPDPPVPVQAGDLVCPSCAHVFAPPDVMIVTREDVRRYGRDPVQCPECDHIWDARRKIRTIRG